MMPLIGLPLVIDRPDSVSRVIPPSTTMPTIIAATHEQPDRTIARGGRSDRIGGGLLKHRCAF